jgi:8-oxo-dGTP pyrophosphatase MutT (NUDIX family)
MSAAKSAAKEAYEEAGIKGRLLRGSVGKYEFPKWGGICRCKVYLLEINKILKHWDEDHFRKRKLMPVKKAAGRVDMPELATMIHNLPKELEYRGKSPKQ